ncbi:hypothetical protein [Umezawaea sp. Da 62-37]|uniref:hypothetical protein n=1 Tax=Umezawaea sp. Da 62-37 TaxID=3075927 RepID=UPI0028F739BF|nr:hypothetical protein [Umezawaea sp. Da 62-37]WNV82913.1 hypothetical protein RM788_32570 [Umezawaea sp. Da 62-37]
MQHVVGDDEWAFAVGSLVGGGVEAFEGAARMFSLLLGRYSFPLRGDPRSPHDLCTFDS